MTQKFEKLSPARLSVPLLEGLELVNRGKVRDTYRLKDGKLLPVVTDGISVFDFVLNTLVPDKGYVLAAMTHFWLLYLEEKGIKTHFVAAGKDIDHYLPEHLRGNTDLQRRAMVVEELDMIPVEFIARFCYTGSIKKEYEAKGTIYGKEMPKGLKDGDLLEHMIFTPTTKAAEGHDEEISEAWVRTNYREAVAIFERGCEFTAERVLKANLLFADGKGELGRDKKGVIRWGDEWGTGDSSRLWDLLAHKKMRGDPNRKAPPPLDKQYMRNYVEENGVSTKLDPKNPEHVAKAHTLEIPQDIVDATSHLYRYACDRLLGMNVEEYGRQRLGVNIPYTRKRVAFLFGSVSDIPQMKASINVIAKSNLGLHIDLMKPHVMSCHRNTKDLLAFVDRDCDGADVVIAIAGKAAALPGMLDALIHQSGQKVPVIGVGIGKPGTESYEAARLSIKQLPNEPVIMDEVRGEPYMNAEGLDAAIKRIAYGELPPPTKRPHKPAMLNIDLNKY